MELLEKVKANLILQHSEDDALLQEYIKAAVAYAESYQKKPEGYYAENPMPPTTEQAVIMLSSHFYESRDGSTAGFFWGGIVCRQDSRYGIQLIYCCGSTGIGRCKYGLWENENFRGHYLSQAG